MKEKPKTVRDIIWAAGLNPDTAQPSDRFDAWCQFKLGDKSWGGDIRRAMEQCGDEAIELVRPRPTPPAVLSAGASRVDWALRASTVYGLADFDGCICGGFQVAGVRFESSCVEYTAELKTTRQGFFNAGELRDIAGIIARQLYSDPPDGVHMRFTVEGWGEVPYGELWAIGDELLKRPSGAATPTPAPKS